MFAKSCKIYFVIEEERKPIVKYFSIGKCMGPCRQPRWLWLHILDCKLVKLVDPDAGHLPMSFGIGDRALYSRRSLFSLRICSRYVRYSIAISLSCLQLVAFAIFNKCPRDQFSSHNGYVILEEFYYSAKFVSIRRDFLYAILIEHSIAERTRGENKRKNIFRKQRASAIFTQRALRIFNRYFPWRHITE